MKTCPNCQSEVESNFNLCWNCNYSFTENKVVEILEKQSGSREIECLRCQVPMEYSGIFKFYEGPLIQIIQNRETFELYKCPECGKVEFFMPNN
jgi:predicted amidophosphoribosyltransferase